MLNYKISVRCTYEDVQRIKKLTEIQGYKNVSAFLTAIIRGDLEVVAKEKVPSPLKNRELILALSNHTLLGDKNLYYKGWVWEVQGYARSRNKRAIAIIPMDEYLYKWWSAGVSPTIHNLYRIHAEYERLTNMLVTRYGRAVFSLESVMTKKAPLIDDVARMACNIVLYAQDVQTFLDEIEAEYPHLRR